MDESEPGGVWPGDVVVPAKPKRAAARAAPKAKRKIAWSKKRQVLFLQTLGEVANVSAACRASGLADTTVYRRRRADPAFLAAWQEALREGVARLEAELLDRALNGVEKEVWHGGKKVGSVRHYNDSLALALLRAHGPAAGRAPAPAPADIEQLREETKAWLGEMNARMGGEG